MKIKPKSGKEVKQHLIDDIKGLHPYEEDDK